MPPSLAFRPKEHLRRPADFKHVYDRRRSVSDHWLILYACENGLGYSRLGMSVSRKFGGAVQRNRLRRLYREAFRHTRQELATGFDLILIPRSSETPSLEELQRILPRLLGQLVRRIIREAGSA